MNPYLLIWMQFALCVALIGLAGVWATWLLQLTS